MKRNALLFTAYVNNLVTRVTDRLLQFIYLRIDTFSHNQSKRQTYRIGYLLIASFSHGASVFVGVAFPAIL